MQSQIQLGEQGGEGQTLTQVLACRSQGVGVRLTRGRMGQQDAGLFKGFAQGRHKQAGGFALGQIGLAQLGVQGRRRAIQTLQQIGVGIGRIQFAARKHKGASQYRGGGVPFEQQHFQAGGAVAQHDHGGRVQRGGGHNV